MASPFTRRRRGPDNTKYISIGFSHKEALMSMTSAVAQGCRDEGAKLRDAPERRPEVVYVGQLAVEFRNEPSYLPLYRHRCTRGCSPFFHRPADVSRRAAD